MISIRSDLLSAEISTSGAQLKSLKREPSGFQLLWTGEDPRYWRNSAPILFPIVGALPEDEYSYEGKTYHMQNHGFSRSREFEVVTQSADSVELRLVADEETKAQYPFDFDLRMIYTIQGNVLIQRFVVKNAGETVMPFSFGGHPGFRCPAFDDESFEDYSLAFELGETVLCRKKEGRLLAEQRYRFLKGGSVLPLSKRFFGGNAILLDSLKSRAVSLVSAKHGAIVTLRFDGFTHLGLWSGAGDDPFVCIEPWYGIDSRADFKTLEEKEGILMLQPGETKDAFFRIEAGSF